MTIRWKQIFADEAIFGVSGIMEAGENDYALARTYGAFNAEVGIGVSGESQAVANTFDQLEY